jgi:hypothetical protein
VAVATWQSWVRDVPELALIYGVTALPMGIALIQRRGTWRHFVRWPFLAALAALLGAFVWMFIRARMLAANPHLTKP